MSSSKKPSRRDFLKATSSAAMAAAATQALNASAESTIAEKESSHFAPAELFASGPQRTYSGERTTQIALPIGGIGAGSICMNGYGGLQDFSIHTRPENTALPSEFSANSPEAAFAILHIKGESPITKLVEGPFPAFKIFDQGLQGQGLRRAASKVFRAFKNVRSRANTHLERRL